MNPWNRAVIVGGSGAVGSLIARQLAGDNVELTVVDTAAPPDPVPGVAYLEADITAPISAERSPAVERALATADLVVLAVPEPIAIAGAAWIVDLLPARSLLVDTLSVKTRFAAAVTELFDGVAPHSGPAVLGINPMFAPSLGFTDRPVAVVVYRSGDSAREFMALLRRWGARVVDVDADHHDRLAATTQALTHAAVLAFGLALGSLNADAEDIAALAPPPHLTMVAMLARITAAQPEVYWDVQVANPYAKAARAALADAVATVSSVSDRASEDEFADMMSSAGGPLGSRAPEFAALCADLFGIVGIRRPSSTDGNRP